MRGSEGELTAAAAAALLQPTGLIGVHVTLGPRWASRPEPPDFSQERKQQLQSSSSQTALHGVLQRRRSRHASHRAGAGPAGRRQDAAAVPAGNAVGRGSAPPAALLQLLAPQSRAAVPDSHAAHCRHRAAAAAAHPPPAAARAGRQVRSCTAQAAAGGRSSKRHLQRSAVNLLLLPGRSAARCRRCGTTSMARQMQSCSW